MVILKENILSESNVTVQNGYPSYPISNLFTNTLLKVTAGFNFVIDLGTPTEVKIVCLGNPFFTGDNLIIEGNETNDFTTPSFSGEMGKSSGSNIVFSILSTPQAFRYWRITNEVGEKLSYIGFIYMGDYLKIPFRLATDSPSLLRNDTTSKLSSGIVYVREGFTSKTLEANMDGASDSELDNLRDYFDTFGSQHTVCIPFEDNTSEYEQFSPFYCNAAMEIENKSAINLNLLKIIFNEAK